MRKVMCEACGSVFETMWTDEEAAAEYELLYREPLPPREERKLLCDCCHEKMMIMMALVLVKPRA